MMEDYEAKMAGKKEVELRRYLEKREEYREEAVLAAITELERRGLPVADPASLRAELQESLLHTQEEERLHPAYVPEWAQKSAGKEDSDEETDWEEADGEPQNAEAESNGADVPALYSPSTVVLFSVLSYFIGGLLLLLNLLRLRRYGGAALLVAILTVAILLQGWVLTTLKLGVQWTALIFSALMAFVYVYVMWPSFIGRQRYRPRGWMPPLLISLGIIVLLMALMRQAGIAIPEMK